MSTTRSVSFQALKIRQPIGEFYVGVISSCDLVNISYADIRQMENELDKYLGIQRKLDPKRVKNLKTYVTTLDATFPTSIILAVEQQCALWDEDRSFLTLTATDEIAFDEIAKILDGQHRIEGLRDYDKDDFQINVAIFIDADIADQANIFATVNLAQTKVNKSLVYDLYDYAKSRSPQKTAHDVSVSLDQFKSSPFYKRIKRLGFATSGRGQFQETLTQATVVESIINLISNNPMRDRDELLRGRKLIKVDHDSLKKLPFRNLFIDGNDVLITKILLSYFSVVRDKWPNAWKGTESGQILPKTNGFKALMRFFPIVYVYLTGESGIGSFVSGDMFKSIFDRITLADSDFNTDNFKPGSTGEGYLYRLLKEHSRI